MTSDYAVGLSSFFTRDFKKLGGEVVATLKYSSGDQDFTAQLTELIAKKPDIVFMDLGFVEIPGIPGMRMVVFSLVLLAIILYRREGIMGTRELTWKSMGAFFRRGKA